MIENELITILVMLMELRKKLLIVSFGREIKATIHIFPLRNCHQIVCMISRCLQILSPFQKQSLQLLK